MSVLEVRGLACVRGGQPVFADLSFELRAGELLLLRGPNGSGKSSLLRLLAGLLRPAAGRIGWRGLDAAREPAAYAAALHYVGHADAVKPRLTVGENLAFAAALDGGEPTTGALAAFGLDGLADQPGRFLSAGQRRRVALARLVAAPRPLWLLDEPEVGLDAANRRRLTELVERHRGGGGVVVLASHAETVPAGVRVLDFGP